MGHLGLNGKWLRRSSGNNEKSLFLAKKGGGQLKTKNLIEAVAAHKLRLSSLYFVKIGGSIKDDKGTDSAEKQGR